MKHHSDSNSHFGFLRTGKHKEAVSKPQKRIEFEIRANTRFAPTKGFGTDVGVNLVFTR
jgi:hypothetical protein